MKVYHGYALGIDLGVSSIGAGLVRIDPGSNRRMGVLDAGVRLFPISLGAAERRLNRQQRKNTRRTKLRIRRLKSLMQEVGLLPQATETFAGLMKKPPYQLRAKGVRQPFVSPWELGRCILHMAQNRGAGFLSQREDDAETDSDSQKTAQSYRQLEDEVRGRKITISEYFAERIRQVPPKPVKRRADFVKEGSVDHAVPRFLVQDEFKRLWENQAQHWDVLTPELRQQVYDILFYERPRAPHAVGPCAHIPEEKRLPKLHRLSEMRRIYEMANNIRIQTDEQKMALTRQQRDAIVDRLLAGEAVNKTRAKQLAGLPNRQKLEMDTIKPLAHVAAFKDIPSYWSMSDAEKDSLLAFIAEPVMHDDKLERLMPEDALVEELMDRLDAPNDAVITLLATLPGGRAMLGETATKAVLERLIAGAEGADGEWRPLSEREAADLCGFTAEEEMARMGQNTWDALPYYGAILRSDVTPIHPWHKDRAAPEEREHGRVPNPAVHVALNQLRKVVNEIIERYGKPTEIHVELTREFGKSAKQREEIEKRNKENRDRNEAVNEELRELGLRRNFTNRTKYKLWKEQNGVDMFTLQEISPRELESYEIEHLIPRSAGGGDGLSNLALVEPNANRGKGEQYPYEFLSPKDNWPQILTHARGLPDNKAWRFESDARERFESEGDEDAEGRLMRDTSYMAKLAARYLRAVSPSVVSVRGVYTAKLRRAWNLEGLEYELFPIGVDQELFDPETGEVRRNPEWKGKPRIDHRHHAMDALVAACTTRPMVQAMGRAYRGGLEYDYSLVPFPWGDKNTFRHSVIDALQVVKPSHKPDHDPSGALHKETQLYVVGAHPGKPGYHIIRYERKFDKLATLQNVRKIVFDTKTIPLINDGVRAHHELLQQTRDAILSVYPEARVALEKQNEEREREGYKPLKLSERNILAEAVRRARAALKLGPTYPCYDNKASLFFGPNGRVYESGSNFAMHVFVDVKGKVGWEIVTTGQAHSEEYVPQWKQAGLRLLWVLHKGDMIEMDVPEEFSGLAPDAERALFVVQKFRKGQMQVVLANDSRPLASNTFKGAVAKAVSGEKGLSYFTKYATRKVELTPFGKIIRKHKALWHGAQT